MKTSTIPGSVRRTAAAAVVTILAGWAPAGPAAALTTHSATAAGTYGMSSGRVAPTAVAVLSLVAAVLGGLSLARRPGRPGRGTGSGRRGAVVAIVLGLVCATLGGVLAATAGGGLGTGNGLAGSVIGLVLGIVAVLLGGLALARSHRPA